MGGGKVVWDIKNAFLLTSKKILGDAKFSEKS